MQCFPEILKWLCGLVGNHPYLFGLVTAIFGVCFMACLPFPGTYKSTGGFYGCVYRFCQVLRPMLEVFESRRGIVLPFPAPLPPQPPGAGHPAPEPGTVQLSETTQTSTATVTTKS
jgi:hypothetical protein